jgi:hypothetical protein
MIPSRRNWTILAAAAWILRGENGLVFFHSCPALLIVECFVPIAPLRYRFYKSGHLYSATRETLSTSTPTDWNDNTKVPAAADDGTKNSLEESSLSDVDARVLRSLLQEKKLSLDTEEDVRKLLERGTVKTAPRPFSSTNTDRSSSKDESNYSSQVLQTLADTKLWRKLSTRAAELAESVGIWVTNKVEQDVKVLAALGFFAWDRAVRDVARALPATASTSTSSRRPWALSNSTSFRETELTTAEDSSEGARRRRILEQMNQPVDEIQSISREIWSILKSEPTSTATSTSTTEQRRGLRTVAPAGSANAAERQRRAYQRQRQKVQAQQNIPGQVLSSGTKLVDTAWELQRELQAETNVPGYKTEPVRTALAAGVTATVQALQSVPEQARLAAQARRAARLASAAESTLPSNVASSRTNAVESSSTATLPTDMPRTVEEKEHDSTMDSYASSYSQWQAGASNRRSPARVVEEGDFFIETTMSSNSQSTPAPALEASESLHQEQLSLLVLLQAERYRMMERLTRCIDDPTAAWLTPDVVDSLPNQNLDDLFLGPGMQTTLTQLMRLRDDVLQQIASASSSASTEQDGDSATWEELEQLGAALVSIRARIEVICDRTSTKVSDVISKQLRYELLENRGGDGSVGPLSFSADSADGIYEIPLILRVENVLAQFQASSGKASRRVAIVEPVASGYNATPEIFDVIPDALFVDVIPDAFAMDTNSASYTAETEMDATGAGLLAEIVTDDDFDSAVGAAKVAFSNTDPEVDASKEEPNIVTQAALRSLDVAFFLLERVLIVGIPSTVRTISTAATRVEEVNRNGQGYVGWKQLNNLADTKGRY